MAEQENVQIIQGAFEAFGRGDIQWILDRVAEDVAWEEAGPPAIQSAGSYKGREGVARFFQNLDRDVEFERFEPREFIAQGDRVVSLGFVQGRARSTGRQFSSEWAMVFTIRDGKITYWREYWDPTEAAAAHT